MQSEKIIFKNECHGVKYRLYMQSFPEYLRMSAEVQAAIYFIAFIESDGSEVAKYLFAYIEHSLSPCFFDNPDTKSLTNLLARRLWTGIYLAFREEWLKYFSEVVELDILKILKREELETLSYLINIFKNAESSFT